MTTPDVTPGRSQRTVLQWTGILLLVPVLSVVLYHICPHWNHIIDKNSNGICPASPVTGTPPGSAQISESHQSTSKKESKEANFLRILKSSRLDEFIPLVIPARQVSLDHRA